MRRLNRRQTLAGLGSVSLGALLAACSDDDSPTASVETSEGSTSTAEPKGGGIAISPRASTTPRAAADRRADRGSVLLRRRPDPQRHPRGPRGREAAAGRARARGRGVRADPQRRRGHLALRRDRELLGVRGRGGRDLPARRAGHERGRDRRVHDGLSRLVPGPDRAHPRQGPHRQADGADHPALLLRRLQREGLRGRALLGRRAATASTRTTRSTARSSS